MTVILSLKVYEPASRLELPFRVPPDPKILDDNSNLRPGYHSFPIELTEDELDQALNWAKNHGSVLKIIGTETVS